MKTIITLIALVLSFNSFASEPVNCAAIDDDAKFEMCLEGTLSKEDMAALAVEQKNKEKEPVFFDNGSGGVKTAL
tara:strand:- start:1529 stop:1753 length:225 start_codon:yes stop_codon:yes gene_type:complete